MDRLTEKEINRVKYNYWKNHKKTIDKFFTIMEEITDKTVEDMESKFGKKYDKDQIEGYVRGKFKNEWWYLTEWIF